MLFDFECCSLAQEMNFVNFYLPYFKKLLINGPVLVLLPFQALFTENLHGDQILAPLSSLVHLQHPAPSAVC
jgi:hypothetical protein